MGGARADQSRNAAQGADSTAVLEITPLIHGNPRLNFVACKPWKVESVIRAEYGQASCFARNSGSPDEPESS
jgi:hypothetical protein